MIRIVLLVMRACAEILILSYASAKDVKYHEVPPFVTPLIVLATFIGFNFKEDLLPSIICFAVIFVLMLAITLISKDKGFGGADIKIFSATGFLLGFPFGLVNLIAGILIDIVLILILRTFKKLEKNQPFPMIPGIAVSTAVILILNIMKEVLS